MNQIFVGQSRGETRVALMENGHLAEYYCEKDGQGRMVGNIYMGKVQNVLPGMQAAFVDIGTDKNAFLYLGDAMANQRDFQFDKGDKPIPRKDRVSVGQTVMVQVVKEPEGQKGPRVTMHVTIPGRLTVLITDMDYIGVSRRIEDETERERLREQAETVRPEGMGMILRTAALGLTAKELGEDIAEQLQKWEKIHSARHVTPPRCIHQDDTLLRRAVRDLMRESIDEMVVEGKEAYGQVLEFARSEAPECLPRLRLYEENASLFDSIGLESKLDKALARKVWLKNGGYLIFDQAEALLVIDVNTGKFVGNKDLQDTVYRMNVQAAQEIARQLRLRDVGGIVIIDFIDMQEKEQQEKLLAALGQALKDDRNKTNLVGLTGLGLVELTRKKSRMSLSRTLEQPCPQCGGSGHVLQAEQVARRILAKVDRMRMSGTDAPLRLEVSKEVSCALENLGGQEGLYVEVNPYRTLGSYVLETMIAQPQ